MTDRHLLIAQSGLSSLSPIFGSHAMKIQLDESQMLASGGTSRVFLNPCDSETVIKVINYGNKRLQLASAMGLGRHYSRYGEYRGWYREIEEYMAAMARIKKLPDFVAEIRGFVQTNLGPGLVTERIAGPDGNNADTLAAAAASGVYPKSLLQTELDTLLQKILETRMMVGDLSLGNIVVGRSSSEGGMRLVIVDGLGERTLIKIKSLSHWVYRFWLMRQRAVLKRQLDQLQGTSKNPRSVTPANTQRA